MTDRSLLSIASHTQIELLTSAIPEWVMQFITTVVGKAGILDTMVRFHVMMNKSLKERTKMRYIAS